MPQAPIIESTPIGPARGPAGEEDGALDYTDRRAILVVGDTEDDRSEAAAAVVAGGGRVAFRLTPADAVARLDIQARTGGVFVQLRDIVRDAAGLADLQGLLIRLNADAVAGRYASIVSTPQAMIDVVAASTPHQDVHQLVGATAAQRAAAAALAGVSHSARLHDSGGGTDSLRLRQLTDEVGRIAGALARLSAETIGTAREPDRVGRDASHPSEPVMAEEIRGVIRARRLRSQYFDAELFADPAWDMLLDLMAAHIDQQRVAVSSLCIASAVPATTALRWIKTLTDCGLFVRRADPTDGRRVFIELGDTAARGMSGYFSALKRMAPAAGGLAI